MKNEIDELLTAMFRNGVLNVKRNNFTPTPSPSLVWDENDPTEMAQTPKKSSVGDLTRTANEDLNRLQTELKKDGMEAKKAVNSGAPQNVDAAFLEAGRAVADELLGQDEFLAAVGVAYRRPFVVSDDDSPLTRALVRGGKGTGRHSALLLWAKELHTGGVLKSNKLTTIDLAAYTTAGSEKIFGQDLYAALKGGAVGLVFEHFEACRPTVLSLVSDLFVEGKIALQSRYAEQKGMLVEIGASLVPGAVSSLSAAGKYLFLLTEQSESKVADAFGMPFLSALDDICETKPFEHETILELSRRELARLCEELSRKLQLSVTVTPEAESILAQAYRVDEGVESLKIKCKALYLYTAELRLHGKLPDGAGVLTAENGELALKINETILFGEPDGAAAKTEAIEAVKQELSDVIGLESVKQYILSLEDNFLIQQLRKERGLKSESPSMHMIFTGNPGTGKTTVARLVARYLKAIGVLSGGQLVEVTRTDLVGQYVGHTAPQTQKAIESALGGALFIDEAYSLYRGRDDSFGLEAIDTLVKGMEDHRDELLVILAGYSHEMEEFLTANSGLRSRFPNIIEFPDYTAEELCEITESIVKSKGYRLADGCKAILLDTYAKRQQNGDFRTNGNGRMARNTVEAAILNCSRRVLNTPPEQRDYELLLPEDFNV